MIIDVATRGQNIGYFNNYIPKLEDKKDETERVKKILERESKKIQPIYSAKGKIVEYNEHGRCLDTYA